MEKDMIDKTVIITGGASGIGKAAALLFAAHGANVAVSDIRSEDGEKVAGLIKEKNGSAIFIKTDVSNPAQVKELIAKTTQIFGGLHYAFNNAGIEGKADPIDRMDVEEFQNLININLKGVWLCMKYEIQWMLDHSGGSIVNTSSVAGLVGFPGIAHYTASKHAINGLTKAVALEYAQKGIRVNAVCPGVIETAMIDRYTGGDSKAMEGLVASEPVGRMGKPEEIAEAALWLCSEKGSFVTGHTMVVDGGMTAQ